MTTIILGHTGFLGSALLGHLRERGERVEGFSSRTLDLRDLSAFGVLDELVSSGATLVMASAVTPDRGQTLESLADNFAMCANLARYLQAHPVARCVYISSDAVYPMLDDAVTELTAVDPSNFYALAKYNGERILQSVADSQGVPLLIVRPTGVFGAGDTHNSYGPNRFIRSIAEMRSIKLFGNGEETRDHIYLEDAVRLIAELMAANATGIFNVATGESRTFGSIADLLVQLVPFEIEIVNAPRSGPITHRRFDISRLAAAVPGFAFTPFEDALQATLASAIGAPA